MNALLEKIMFPERMSIRRYIVAALYMLLIITTAASLGAFEASENLTPANIRERNAAIGMPLFTMFIWLAVGFSFYNVEQAIIKFSLAIESDGEFDSEQTVAELRKRSIKNLKFSIFLGIQTTAFYIWYENLLTDTSDTLPLFLTLAAVPFWISGWLLILQLYTLTQYIINNIIKHQTLDLFGLKTLLPLSDQFISFIIITAIVFAGTPVFWVGTHVPMLDIIIIGMMFLFLCVFFFRPILHIQNRMHQKKKLALSRINKSIVALMQVKEGSCRRITENPKRLREVSALINAKNEISDTSEWAISVPQRIRAVFFVVSIPLSWIAGSLVETGISIFPFF